MGVISSSPYEAVTEHQPRVSLPRCCVVPGRKQRKKTVCPLWSTLLSMSNRWWMAWHFSGHACLGVSQWYAARLLPGCPVLLALNGKSVTEHYTWKTENGHSRLVIKRSLPSSLTFLIWARHHHTSQFITAKQRTRRVERRQSDVYGILEMRFFTCAEILPHTQADIDRGSSLVRAVRGAQSCCSLPTAHWTAAFIPLAPMH